MIHQGESRASSLQYHLEKAAADHLITHIRQNSKHHIRKIVTIDPALKETTRKARILQSFANKKIATVLRADLEKNYGEERARFILTSEQYQDILTHGLTVMKGREIYAKASSYP